MIRVSRKGVNTPCKIDADRNKAGAICTASSTCQSPAGFVETEGRCIQQSGGALLPGPPVRPSVNQTLAGHYGERGCEEVSAGDDPENSTVSGADNGVGEK